MMEWRDQCDSTIRVATQILSRGTPKLGDELAEVSQAVLLGKIAPKAAAERLETGLKGWHAPHQGNQAKGQNCQCDVVAPAPAVAPSVTSVSAVPAPLPSPSAEVEQALSNELEAPQQ